MLHIAIRDGIHKAGVWVHLGVTADPGQTPSLICRTIMKIPWVSTVETCGCHTLLAAFLTKWLPRGSEVIDFILFESVLLRRYLEASASCLKGSRYKADYKILTQPFETCASQGRRGGQQTITGCSCRGPGFSSQHPHGGSQPP